MSRVPKGRPTTSTERMRLKKLRDAGKADPIKLCKVCGKRLKKGAGANRAYDMDLCHFHWRQTPEGKAVRRQKQIKTELWGVWYFGGNPLEGFTSVRKAIAASKNENGKENDPVFAVWSDGRVTCHVDLTHRAAVGMKPEDGDELIDDFEDLRAEVPENLRVWF